MSPSALPLHARSLPQPRQLPATVRRTSLNAMALLSFLWPSKPSDVLALGRLRLFKNSAGIVSLMDPSGRALCSPRTSRFSQFGRTSRLPWSGKPRPPSLPLLAPPNFHLSRPPLKKVASGLSRWFSHHPGVLSPHALRSAKLSFPSAMRKFTPSLPVLPRTMQLLMLTPLQTTHSLHLPTRPRARSLLLLHPKRLCSGALPTSSSLARVSYYLHRPS